MDDAAEKPPLPATPLTWRLAIAGGVLLSGSLAYLLQEWIGSRGQAVFGMLCIIGMVALFSSNLRAISWRTLIAGFVLQWLLALFTLRFSPGYALFHAIGEVVKQFLQFTQRGAAFVFGPLAGGNPGFVFAFASTGLPVIIFVSSFFTVLYYLGVLQWVVRLFARGMVVLMGTSGAESLTAAANVFMGQTEAPLIVKPYIGKMTQSELFAMMVTGMATISGALMAVYIGQGADQVSILATSVMAAPAALYLSKLLIPETEVSETGGVVKAEVETPYRNVIDAAAAGASEGMYLALNVAAMLVAFLAFVSMFEYLLGLVPVGSSLTELLSPEQDWYMLVNLLLTVAGYYVLYLGLVHLQSRVAWLQPLSMQEKPIVFRAVFHVIGYVLFLLILEICLQLTTQPLSLQLIFSHLFAPLAFLMGVQASEVSTIANLLGTKLVLNEFVAYGNLSRLTLSRRSRILATFALTGFANFGSIGIQLGGIGAMAPHRRPDLARFGLRALYVGFLVTVLNATIAGILVEDDE